MTKQELIKKHAYELFVAKNYELASVNEIVAACAISKGSYYTYYQTKEEVYLSLLKDFYHVWFVQIKKELATPVEMPTLIETLLTNFVKNPAFIELASKSQVIIESNIEGQVLLEFKSWLYQNLNDVSLMMSLKYHLNQPEVFRKLIQTYSIVIGLWLGSKIPGSIASIKADFPIDQLFIDFSLDIVDVVQRVWKFV